MSKPQQQKQTFDLAAETSAFVYVKCVLVSCICPLTERDLCCAL